MNSCQHDIDVKMVNGTMVSFCKKCGKIFSQQTSNNRISCESQLTWGFSNDGSKQILHD